MKFDSRLHNALMQWISQPGHWAHLGHLKTGLWMIVALIQTGSINLTRWTVYMPCRGQLASSKQRRIQRWIHNPRINVHRLYKPLIQAANANWQSKTIFLALDTSEFWNEYCLVRRLRCTSGSCLTCGLESHGTFECQCLISRLSRDD